MTLSVEEQKLLEKIEKLVKNNNDQLIVMNGKVKRNIEDIGTIRKTDIFLLKKRISTIEKDDFYNEGVRAGENKMKASTKTIIVIILTACTCLISGWALLQQNTKNMKRFVSAGMVDRFTGQNGTDLDNKWTKELENLQDEIEYLREINGK